MPGQLVLAFSHNPGSDVVCRYPTVAAEILTSEIWVIPETILSNKDTLLRPFWDAVIPPVHTGAEEEEANTPRALYEVSEAYRARVEFGTDEDDERDRKREIIRGLWVKVNGNLIAKRSHEVCCSSKFLTDYIRWSILSKLYRTSFPVLWLKYIHLRYRIFLFVSFQPKKVVFQELSLGYQKNG